MPTWKGTEASLSYVQSFWYLVSSSVNVSIFHSSWQDTLQQALTTCRGHGMLESCSLKRFNPQPTGPYPQSGLYSVGRAERRGPFVPASRSLPGINKGRPPSVGNTSWQGLSLVTQAYREKGVSPTLGWAQEIASGQR